MAGLRLNGSKAPGKVLCLGAHSDDIEIGCGGTILRLLQTYENVEIVWVLFSGDKPRRREALESANRFLRHAQRKTVIVKAFRESFFYFNGMAIKEFFEQLKQKYDPDVIFTHYRHDLHQDHRTISELTWNTFRNHLILEYEIPKYDGDMGSPNVFVHLNQAIGQTKVRNIVECFASQAAKQWFTEDTFLSVMRLRGVESNAPKKYAEAFYCRKIVF